MAGLTYVALSRATSISNIGIAGGISAERLTTAISKAPGLRGRIIAEIVMYKNAISILCKFGWQLGQIELQE